MTDHPDPALVDVRDSCAKPTRAAPAQPVYDAFGFEVPPEAPESSRSRLRRLRSEAAQALHGTCALDPFDPKAHFASRSKDQQRGHWYSVTACGKVPAPGQSEMVLTQKASGRVDAMGILRCGSIWTCPECIQRIAYERAQEIRYTIDQLRTAGYFVTMNTGTVPHDRTISCLEAFDRLKRATSLFTKSHVAREIREAAGLVGFVRVVEVTWSPSSGWHVHFHEIAGWSGLGGMTDGSPEDDRLTAETLGAAFKASWNRAIIDVTGGRQAHSEFGYDCRPVWSVNDYAMKLPEKAVAKDNAGKKRWGADAELSAMQMKDGKGDSLSYLNLLQAAGDGSRQAVVLIREYAQASFGRRQMEWSRPRTCKGVQIEGLREIVGIGRDRTNEEIAIAEPNHVFEDELANDADQSHIPIHRVHIPVSDAWRARACGGRHTIDKAVRAVQTYEGINLADELASRGWIITKTMDARTRVTQNLVDGVLQESNIFEPNEYIAHWPLRPKDDSAIM